jgi:hypothetical protein
MIDPIVLDDVIPESFQDEVHTAIKTQVTWQYEQATSMGSKDSNNFIQGYDVIEDSNTIDGPQFTHYALLNGQPSPALQLIRPILYFVEKKLDWIVTDIGRIKINSMTRNGPNFTKDNYNIPHVDMPGPGLLSMVYYVNNSDGDTFLFNEFQNSNKVSSVSLKQRVTPKKGRAVIFDSNRFHASSNPINNSTRFVINFTFKLHEKTLASLG